MPGNVVTLPKDFSFQVSITHAFTNPSIPIITIRVFIFLNYLLNGKSRKKGNHCRKGESEILAFYNGKICPSAN